MGWATLDGSSGAGAGAGAGAGGGGGGGGGGGVIYFAGGKVTISGYEFAYMTDVVDIYIPGQGFALAPLKLSVGSESSMPPLKRLHAFKAEGQTHVTANLLSCCLKRASHCIHAAIYILRLEENRQTL